MALLVVDQAVAGAPAQLGHQRGVGDGTLVFAPALGRYADLAGALLGAHQGVQDDVDRRGRGFFAPGGGVEAAMVAHLEEVQRLA